MCRYLQLTKPAESITEIDLIVMVYDIVKGMMYIQSKGVIHRVSFELVGTFEWSDIKSGYCV
jgi:hypothetical protein